MYYFIIIPAKNCELYKMSNATVTKLQHIFKECQQISSDLIKLSIQILEEIKDTRSYIYTSLVKEYSYIPIKKIQHYMMVSVDRLIHDAETFLKERESEQILDDLEDNYPEYSEAYPFVSGVWSGDIFDRSEIKGFETLKKELTNSFAILKDESLFIDFLRKNYLDTY